MNQVQYISDYSASMECQLKADHSQYCLFLKPQDYSSGNEYDAPQFGFSSKMYYIFVEAFHPKYKEVYEFLIKIAEPVNKPNFVHVYKITLFSMYTAMSLNIDAAMILEKLREYSKNLIIPHATEKFIKESTEKAGSAYLYMIKKNYYLKIHEPFLQEALDSGQLRSPFSEIAVREENPPKEIMSNTESVSFAQSWNFSFYKIINKDKLFEVTELIIKEGIALINEYNADIYSLDPPISTSTMASSSTTEPTSIPKKLDIQLKQITQPRIYQQKALKSIFVSEKPRSATIVLPCGAGKTLLGIIVTEKVKGNTLVICDIDTATKQWKNEFLRWTTVKPDRIKIQTGKMKNVERPDKDNFILITTFKQLSSIIKKNQNNLNQSKNQIDDSKYGQTAEQIIQDMEWDLCIADETQYSAAKTYKKIFQTFNFKLKIGLTATPYREDNRIDDLFHVIGPKLYEANISELIQDSYLAKPYCVLFRCDMSQELQAIIDDPSRLNKVSYYSGNPRKYKLLAYLLKLHELRKDKILVFCDQINVLKHYSRKLGYPAIYGDVQLTEKLVWLDLFRKGHINTLFLSRVGDTALDLPIANVCIQIGFQYGSRRQEVQRLGRIMRRKEGQKGEYNAFFYTIVSKRSDQAGFYQKRQKSLMDLGINFEVVDETQVNYDENILTEEMKQRAFEFEKDTAFLDRQEVEGKDSNQQ